MDKRLVVAVVYCVYKLVVVLLFLIFPEIPPLELPPVQGNPDEEPAEFEVRGDRLQMMIGGQSSTAPVAQMDGAATIAAAAASSAASSSSMVM